MSSLTQQTEAQAKKASYMRDWRAKNPGRNSAIRDAYKQRLAESPSDRAKYRALCNARSKKYASTHMDQIRKSANERYTPERGRAQRDRIDPKHIPNNIVRAAKCRAKKGGIAFDLTPEWYAQETLKGCAVTGLAFETVGSKSPWVAHIDRKVPANGYVISNCRLVCACFNLARKNWSDEDVLRMAKALIAYGGAE